ncbi:hypothetical protein LPJ81_002326 [Coemansia sp. IMI 209127]|nr:hypothetical protein LPJ81_002326 [Coemansia sp. IMI 209127]
MDDPEGESVVIKDYWAISSNRDGVPDDKSNEVRHLKLIDEKLKDLTLTFPYSKVVMAGDVRFKLGRKHITDSTNELFNYEPEDDDKYVRVHRRVVLQPYGSNLDTVRNEYELIVVLTDAMKCHNTILRKCNILHRDISSGNIMVVRDSNPVAGKCAVHGLLIDFDNAASVGLGSGHVGNDTCSGTHPYMSIDNLEGAPGRRTALDDWESLLYLICWLGTMGVNRDDCKKRERNDNWAILVQDEFMPEYKLLKALALYLHGALFNHQECRDTVNSLISDSDSLSEQSDYLPDDVDSPGDGSGMDSATKAPKESVGKHKKGGALAQRNKDKDKIVAKLLQIMCLFAENAKAKLASFEERESAEDFESDTSFED